MSFNILETVVELNQIDEKSIKIIMSEVGAGKTTFHKDMPDVAGGDILYLPIGNDKGFNQLKSDKRFKAPEKPLNTVYKYDKEGRKLAITSRILPQLMEYLEAFRFKSHNFKGLTIDAISSVQEIIEEEIKFESRKGLEWDDWSAIKKAMFTLYEHLESIANEGYEVSLQTHFQIREYEDAYSGKTLTRLLPLMTENNAIRVLKNADAVVMIQIMSDEKDPKKVHRMSILGGHPAIPTKLRNEYNLSFDGLLFENLTYGGLVKLMQIPSLDDAANLGDVIIVKEKDKSKLKKDKKSKKQDEVDEDEETKPVKKVKKVKKQEVIEEDDEIEDDEEEKVEVKKPIKKIKKPIKKVVEDEEDDEEDGDDIEEIAEEVEVKKPKKPLKKKVVEEDEDEEEEDDEEEAPIKKKKPLKSKLDESIKKKKPLKKKDIEEDEEDEEEEEDDEEEKVVRKPARKAKQKTVVEDDEEDDEDEDEVEIKKPAKKPIKKVAKKVVEEDDEDYDYEEDDELQDDELFEE
jgi:chemotaxis protein histidine kinase CheA